MSEVPELEQPQWYSTDEVQKIVDRAAAAAVTAALSKMSAQPATPPQQPGGFADSNYVQTAVNEALARQQALHEADLAGLRAQMDSMRGVVTTVAVPEHAGGPGTDIAETWSQWEQSLSHQRHENNLEIARQTEEILNK